MFQPYLVNGTAVPIRTQIVVDFDNTLDNCRDPKGNVPSRLDEKTSRALIVKAARPSYPADARAGRIQDSVVLRVIIGDNGRVLVVHIIRGYPMLTPAAYGAVRSWQFTPYFENGNPVPVDTQLTIDVTQ